VPLTVSIIVTKEHIQTRKCTIVKNSKEEENFIAKLIKAIKRLNIKNIPCREVLEQIIQTFTNDIDRIWHKYSNIVIITKHSKVWWDKNCHRDLKKYRISKQIKDWKIFKSIVKKTKCEFFNQKFKKLLTRIVVHGNS